MQLNKKKLSEVCASALLAGGIVTCIAPAAVYAATAAGTIIKNLATVTYEDTNGNIYSAQSNEAIITVKQVYSAEVGSDTTKTAAAGQTVYIQHTLTNTGNGTDTYTLAALNDSLGDDINADNIKMYLDTNGNGLADAGEQEITGSISVPAGDSVEIVMAVAVPSSAAPGATLGVTLTAATANGTVTDATDVLGGADTTQGTNNDLITVSQNAVLNYTKSATLNTILNQITYVLTVSNTGNVAATAVNIMDGLPVGTTLVSTSYAGLLTTNGDTLPATATLDETAANFDYDHNGTISGSVPGISAVDASIAPGQTISVTFVVDYDPVAFNNNSVPGSAGDIVKNTARLTADLDGPGPGVPGSGPGDFPPISSNPTQTTLPQIYGVQSDDTNAGDALGTNDGGDDDAGTANDIQYVDAAPAGSTVLFDVVLTNTGTGPDTLELAINKGDFPPGTTFTFWNETGTAQLTNTNSGGGVDTGMLDSGESKTILVKAQLPADATGTNLTATLTATSANDPSATPISDTTTLELGSIGAPGVDLHDTSIAPTGADDDLLALGALTGDPAYETTVGGTVVIPFHIDNNGGSSDSFQLSAGSTGDGTTVGSLPTGWTVKFYQADASGNPIGSPLTSTALLAPGSTGAANPTSNIYVAVVSIPSDPALAVADYAGTNAFDANGDLDGDQPILIKITSANSGATDTMLDAIDVADLAQVVLTPPGANQIQPGGSVDYTHVLDNTGNTEETLELDANNGNPDWNNTVTVMTNNGPKTLDQLVPGTDVIIGTGPDGTPVNVTFTDTDTDGNPEVTLPPGVSINLTPTVYAPSDAAPGNNDILTIIATNTGNGPSASIEDVSTVILGQVRLTKTVAYDASCDGTPDGAFAATLTTNVAPDECAIWQIVAENQGDAAAKNVIITDAVPTFTTFVTGSLAYKLGASTASFTPLDGANNGDQGRVLGSDVMFFVGTGGVEPSTGGTLAPGEMATVRFSTRVD